MDFKEALDYLYARLPMYQRVGASAYKKSLDNTLELCAHLSNPHHNFKSIHIAGTNGKGSTAHMLAAVLQEAGYDTGLYTSPHLKRFTERIRVNGNEVTEDYVCRFVEDNTDIMEALQPSFFEVTVAMAFDYFSKQDVDIAIIETGLGGRLDSTNVCWPELSVITNIGFDHMDMLGNTLELIAAEKAGIIKSKVPVIIGNFQKEVSPIFKKVAKENNSELFYADQIFKCTNVQFEPTRMVFDIEKNGKLTYERLALDLPGSYQTKNIPAVLLALDLLPAQDFVIELIDIRRGLANVHSVTGLKGRWQKLQSNPSVYCDTAHNIDGVMALLENINRQNYAQLHMVWGMVTGKEIEKIVDALPLDAKYYFCQPAIPRGLSAEDLAVFAGNKGRVGQVIPDVNQALATALENATADDLIFVGGSTFVVAEIDNL
ncbi:MAG: bifunctional folylpolyglutamate synthase/dihydrofolate synthase [Cyclobacteriaceae bacterium]